MSDRVLLVAASNLLARGFLTVPTDRRGRDGAPVNALFAVARAIHRVLAFRVPAKAVAVLDRRPPSDAWPEILRSQLASLPELVRALGLAVVEAEDGQEAHLVASYAERALGLGDDVIIAGVDKRFAQLVSDRVWWYDANKDVRYTPEIVKKRFNVPPPAVGEWLALVGDDSGNDVLAGIKGIGAKGATTLLMEHGEMKTVLEKLDTLEGRLAKALKASRDDVTRELERGRLRRDLALPIDLDSAELRYQVPEARSLNAHYERLGFAELLVAESGTTRAVVVEGKGELAPALAKLGPRDIAIAMLLEDPSPVRRAIAGIGLANGRGEAVYVPRTSAAWPELAAWLEDERARKIGHNLVPIKVELRRAGIDLRGAVSDSCCASHLTESSNWAPHDLTVVAKHVLGRALVEEDVVRGVGRKRKSFGAMSVGQVAEYAGTLADASAAIWQKLEPALAPRALYEEYLAIADICASMELTGILVDPAELDSAEASFGEIEKELTTQISELAGHSFNINSGKQLGAVLFEELKLPIVSHTKTGWSTSIEALERIENAHPIVALVLRWRALRRLRDNWLISLRRCIDPADGRVHSSFHPARSFSGQIVNSNPDLGRVPGRTPEMARIRRAFVAGEGRLLMSVDFNQLGLHVLAHLTKDPALVEPLRAREDMHVLTAAAVLDLPKSEISLAQRQLGKVVNFATFAGQGASALALQLGISAEEAKRYIARFNDHYKDVRAFQDEQLRRAHEDGYIVTIAGRRWPIGGLSSLDSQLRSYAERLARRATHEASVQDVSRRALLEAERALKSAGLGAVPVLQILDEVLFDVPEAELRDAARVASDAMKHAYELEVPLKVGVEAGKNWADLEPVTLS